MTAVAIDDRAKVAEIEDPKLLRTADHSTQGAEPDTRRKVECGAGD
jgi:hypothetical protein